MGSLSAIVRPLHAIFIKGEDNSGWEECQPFAGRPKTPICAVAQPAHLLAGVPRVAPSPSRCHSHDCLPDRQAKRAVDPLFRPWRAPFWVSLAEWGFSIMSFVPQGLSREEVGEGDH